MPKFAAVRPTIAKRDIYLTTEDDVVVGGLPGGTLAGLLDNDRGAAPLTVDRLHRLPGSIGEEVTLPSGALLTLAGDGSFLYDPRGAFDSLDPGGRAIDSFVYRASDGLGKADWGRAFIRLEGAAEPPAGADVPQAVRLEAEDFSLPGAFHVETLETFASGGAGLRLALPAEGATATETASAATIFSGADGTYSLALHTFDEGDGAATVSMAVNGRTLDTWVLDGGGRWTPDASNAVTLGIDGVALRSGDVLSVTATRAGEEYVRLDALDLTPQAPSPSTPPSTPPPTPTPPPGSDGTPGTEAIMPLGDSITDGDDNGGYRAPLFRQLDAAGYDVDFVGTLARGASDIDPDNEGHSGWTIDMIADSLPTWLALNPAETVLLMAGTNDLLGGQSGASVARDMAALIDTLFDETPDADLFVAEVLPIDPARWTSATAQTVAEAEAYNALLPDVVAQARADGHSVTFVPMDGIPTSELVDGVHPGQGGFATIADAYYQAMTAAGVLDDAVAR